MSLPSQFSFYNGSSGVPNRYSIGKCVSYLYFNLNFVATIFLLLGLDKSQSWFNIFSLCMWTSANTKEEIKPIKGCC